MKTHDPQTATGALHGYRREIPVVPYQGAYDAGQEFDADGNLDAGFKWALSYYGPNKCARMARLILAAQKEIERLRALA